MERRGGRAYCQCKKSDTINKWELKMEFGAIAASFLGKTKWMDKILLFLLL
jgi:hypothetical protein